MGRGWIFALPQRQSWVGRGLQELDCGYGDPNAEAALERASEPVERFGYEGRARVEGDWTPFA